MQESLSRNLDKNAFTAETNPVLSRMRSCLATEFFNFYLD